MITTLYIVDPVMKTVRPMTGHAVIENDHEADAIRFAFPDSIDLAEGTAVRVMYIRPDGGDPVAKTLAFYKHSGGYHLYDWVLQRGDLKKGTLTFSLCILSVSGGIISEEWHTTPCQISVLNTIHTDDSDEADESITPTVAERVAVLESMIQRVASGAPIVVSSVSAITDTSRIYVLTTDGKWYYYDGSAWVAGGEYGGVVAGSITTEKIADGAVTTAKIADNAVTVAKLSNDITQKTANINTSKMGNITISSGTITPTSNKNNFGTTEPFECAGNTIYTLSHLESGQTSLAYYIYFYDGQKTYLSGAIKYNVSKSTTVTTPENAAYMAFYMYHASGISDGTLTMVIEGSNSPEIYLPPVTVHDVIAEIQIAEMGKRLENAADIVGPFLLDCFEIGNIVMSDAGWTYGTGSGPTRVRTKSRTTLRLKAGTTIGLTNYTDAKYYVGMRQSDGTYENHGWLTENYTVPKDCDCVILIANKTETDQESPIPLASLFFGYTFTDYYAQTKHINYDDAIKNINHRGYNLTAPENTLPAYRLSKLMGFNIVETDVSFTSDGIPVCLHDATINRTARNSDGSEISTTINIADITYEQALTYDFGIWKNTKYAGTKIPTLEQFLVLCKNIGLQAYVEIKTDQAYTEAQIHGLMDLAKKTGMYDRITWISFLPTYLAYVKSYDPKAKMIYVVSAVTNEVISNANAIKQNGNLLAIDAQFSALDSVGIQRCIDADIPLEIWTINSESNILNLDPYVTGVTSDYMIAGKVLYERNIYLD